MTVLKGSTAILLERSLIMSNAIVIAFPEFDFEDKPAASALDSFEGVAIDFNTRRIMELENAIQCAQLALENARKFLDVPRDQMRPTMAAISVGTAQSILKNV
jgi:hypothetical protein